MILVRTVFTIGHSTRSLEDFISILKSFSIQHVADIRHFPGSRRFPHFNKEILAASLNDAGIMYTHIIELGGRRKPKPGSLNTAWRVEAFKGYADHMEGEEFARGINKLTGIAGKQRTAYMCSEAVWWSCHRALVSDYLKWKGWQVFHIMKEDKSEEHPYTKAAVIKDGVLDYGKE